MTLAGTALPVHGKMPREVLALPRRENARHNLKTAFHRRGLIPAA
jgi:hypothetical protein